jgi:Tol biopolymer transport system component
MKQITAFLLICLFALSITPLTAQETSTPLLLTDGGQIYKWENNEVVQLTTSEGYNDSPDYAPDGTQFVYRAWSQITLDYVAQKVEEFGSWGGDSIMPTDIAIYDLATDEIIIVAPQPADADTETLLGAIRRSAPKWSPDGTLLAWTEVIPTLDENQNYVETYQLVVYDIATATSKVLTTDLPPAMVYSIPHDIEWGANGIYMNFFEYNNAEAVNTYLLFSPTGEIQFRVPFVSDTENMPPVASFVAQFNGKEVYALSYGAGMLRLIDETGAIEEITASAPQRYNPQTPHGLANLMIIVNDPMQNMWEIYVTDPNTQFQTLLTDTVYGVNQLQVSPDGASVAFIEPMSGIVNIWNNLTVTPIPSPLDSLGNPIYISDIVWGTQAIRVLQS